MATKKELERCEADAHALVLRLTEKDAQIVRLRQRVKELEEKHDKAYDGWERECETANALRDEIAELRKAQGEPLQILPGGGAFPIIPLEAQGEPVAWYDQQHGDFSRVERLGWAPLYTSAPSIPAPLEYSKHKGPQDYVDGWNDCRDAVLAAAPKPGEQG